MNRAAMWLTALAVATGLGLVVALVTEDWRTATFAAVAACLGAAVVWELAVAVAAVRFLDECEGDSSEQEMALAVKVGLDLATLKEAKAEVRAAVRRVMVRRGAGIAGLASARSASARAAVARASAAQALAEAESSAPETTATADPSAAEVVTGLPSTADRSASIAAAQAAWKDRRDDVE